MLVFRARRWRFYAAIILSSCLLLPALNSFISSSIRFPHPPIVGHSNDTSTLPVTAIVVSTAKQNFSTSLVQLGLRPTDAIVMYVADDRSAPFHPPTNKGREAIAYLTYLIDHYDDLPEIMIFLHANHRTWHHNALLGGDTKQVLSLLRREYVVEKGYANLLCDWRTTCPSLLPLYLLDDLSIPDENPSDNMPRLNRFRYAWAELFRGEKPPPLLASPTGAQFAVTHSTVKKRISRERLQEMQEWIINTPLSSYHVGEIFEYLWHIIFLGPDNAVTCPPAAVCYCQMFRICLDPGDGSSHFAEESLQEWEALVHRRATSILRLSALKADSPQNSSIIAIEHELAEFDQRLAETVDAALDRGYLKYPLPPSVYTADTLPVRKINLEGSLLSH